jgi:hypothetical protein
VRLDAESPRELIAEIECHLRALLRDVLCGYLDADLKSVADDILLESQGEPLGEIEARDLRLEAEEPVSHAPRFDRGESVTFEPELEYDTEPDTAEIEPVAIAPEPMAMPQEPVQHQLDGVTESADWGWDDPEDFSAPV